MKRISLLIILLLILTSCASSNTTINDSDSKVISEDDIVRITNDDTDYEITIIEPGFNSWLASIARPKGYYSQSFMETRNRLFVMNWNNRVLQPQQYNSTLYEMQINYDSNTNYGYDVNYKLYNYFIYFQLTYKQQLSPFVPRI